jgi:hypothetical protein
VRGLLTLYILKNIIDRLNNKRKTTSLPLAKPYKVFDLTEGLALAGKQFSYKANFIPANPNFKADCNYARSARDGRG